MMNVTGFSKQEALPKKELYGWSWNNLASVDMVEKLSLPKKQCTHSYCIHWSESSRNIKVIRTVRVHFTIGTYSDFVIAMLCPCKLVLS